MSPFKAFEVPNFFPALPEIFLLLAACALLITDLFVKSERRVVTIAMAQLILLVCASLTVFVLVSTEGALIYTFSDLFVADVMSHVLKLTAYISVSAALVYSRQYLLDRGLLRGEFVALLLFALLGMMVMMSANSFLTLYLGLELLSLCLYSLVALNRDSAVSTEAAMKYFVLGALASGLLLYGMSMIYGATGTLEITEVARKVGTLASSTSERTFLVFGLVFVVCGLAFKLAAFAMAMRLLVNGLLDLAVDWQPMLAILAVGSMAIGNITAIAQTNLKRMLAYSTIAHMGFMLLGMLAGVVGGNWLNAGESYAAAMFYTIVYVLTTLGSFGMLLYLSHKGFECETLDDLRGLNRRNPWFAFLMLVLMFSLAGVPPTAGFYAKFAVLSAAVSAGQIALAVAAVMFSLIGAFFYLRIVKLMYFDDPRDAAPAAGHADMRLLLSVNGLALLGLGILPQPLMGLCYLAIKNL